MEMFPLDEIKKTLIRFEQKLSSHELDKHSPFLMLAFGFFLLLMTSVFSKTTLFPFFIADLSLLMTADVLTL